MERLTNKREADQQRRNYEKRLEQGYPRNIPEERFLRLAAYEDTGLEPEEIKPAFNEGALLKLTAQYLGTTPDRLHEWAKADKEDRLVALPCKVGDTVYIPVIEKRTVARVRVQGISISVSGRTILRFGGYPIGSVWGNGCGKDWFLTREEAETALSRERKDGEG